MLTMLDIYVLSLLLLLQWLLFLLLLLSAVLALKRALGGQVHYNKPTIHTMNRTEHTGRFAVCFICVSS